MVVRGAWYGCDTGCDGFEVSHDEQDEDRIDFRFGELESEDEARETFDIPDSVVVRFLPGRLDP